jgi:hypothetical protein
MNIDGSTLILLLAILAAGWALWTNENRRTD